MAQYQQGVRIYNLFPRLAGNFTQWQAHILRAKQMGFNWIYINPIQYPGFSGSLYAVKEHYKINPDFIDTASLSEPMEQLKDFLTFCHEHHMYVMMDLVINHTAIDSPLTKTHKSWYKLNEDNEIVRPGAKDENGNWIEWGDLAEIDNENSEERPELWNFWLEMVIFYLNVGFRGFRCDAAYKVPCELWQYLIRRAKETRPNVMFFAETLGCQVEDVVKLAQAGFDYSFNSAKWWDFESEWCIKQNNQTARFTKTIAFPESHDTPRFAGEFGQHEEALKRQYFFSSLFSSGVMMPIGYEFGFTKPLHVVDSRPHDWEETKINLTKFITKINLLKANHKILNEDNTLEMIASPNKQILAVLKRGNDHRETLLILINKSLDAKQTVTFDSLSDLFASREKIVEINLNQEEIKISDNTLTLSPGQVRLLIVRDAFTPVIWG